jgi:hypothetical protein
MKIGNIMTAAAFVLAFTSAYASQSAITESEGTACMGDDKSRKQTEQAAMTDAKKRAVEFVSTYIQDETRVNNFVLEKDMVSAYANAEVKIIQKLEKSWYKDASSGDCCKVRIKAEVVPDTKAMEKMATGNPAAFDDPSAPLKVKAWTDKKVYKEGEKVKVYIKGNKPFYASVLYKDVSGAMIQLLPNPFRAENYFNGGAIYEIPTGNDKFDLEVSPPFGEENIIVYASTSPLGEISTEARGGVYQVKTQTRDLGMKSRSVRLNKKTDDKSSSEPSEFFEDKVSVKTGGKP